MSILLQFLPIAITVVSGSIGIYLKVSEDKRIRFQLILLILILVSGFFAGIQTYRKIQTDEQNKAYEAATTITLNKPFETAIFVIGIKDDNDLDESGTAGFLLPANSKMTSSGHLSILGEGLEIRSFTMAACGPYVSVEEETTDGGMERYLTVDFIEEQYRPLSCSSAIRPGRRWAPGEKGDHWVFDYIAGATGHVIDVNNGDNAGLMLRAAQAETLALLDVSNVVNPEVYVQYLQRNVEFELKFYQNLTDNNPIGDGCQSVYKIPLKSNYTIKKNEVSISIGPADKGALLVCENSPI